MAIVEGVRKSAMPRDRLGSDLDVAALQRKMFHVEHFFDRDGGQQHYYATSLRSHVAVAAEFGSGFLLEHSENVPRGTFFRPEADDVKAALKGLHEAP
jgi:hypothetical protein